MGGLAMRDVPGGVGRASFPTLLKVPSVLAIVAVLALPFDATSSGQRAQGQHQTQPVVKARQGAPSETSTTGRFVINPQFDGAFPFNEGLAAVRIGDYATGKWGFIDKTGAIVAARDSWRSD
jgi:predicted lipid-binding transport protein (Tim44 family)